MRQTDGDCCCHREKRIQILFHAICHMEEVYNSQTCAQCTRIYFNSLMYAEYLTVVLLLLRDESHQCKLFSNQLNDFHVQHFSVLAIQEIRFALLLVFFFLQIFFWCGIALLLSEFSSTVTNRGQLKLLFEFQIFRLSACFV